MQQVGTGKTPRRGEFARSISCIETNRCSQTRPRVGGFPNLLLSITLQCCNGFEHLHNVAPRGASCWFYTVRGSYQCRCGGETTLTTGKSSDVSHERQTMKTGPKQRHQLFYVSARPYPSPGRNPRAPREHSHDGIGIRFNHRFHPRLHALHVAYRNQRSEDLSGLQCIHCPIFVLFRYIVLAGREVEGSSKA